MRILTVSACLLLAAAPVLKSQASSAQLQWGPAPAVFPPGARMAVVSGDPGQAAMFTVILSMPNEYKIPPHFHPTDETVTVKEGMFLVGMGDTFNLAKTSPMASGASGTIPAGQHHFASASGATVVTVTAMGPFAMTYVNPADDPQTHPQARPHAHPAH
jgi:mannose-6-phosphate isomerase-like protein (cupin superfamily)